jgi:hypothetical protein
MNPHAIPKGYSFYTFDKDKADRLALQLGLRVDRYSLGDMTPRDALPWAVWTPNNGALIVNWDTLTVWWKQ